MELSYLREFATFTEYMNVSEAARHLFLSKSALSKHLAGLEREVGVQLFTRDGSLQLTPAGIYLVGESEKLLKAYDNAMMEASSLAKCSGF